MTVKTYAVAAYEVADLSPGAKNKARDFYRIRCLDEGSYLDYALGMIADALSRAGFAIDQVPYTTVGGGTGLSWAMTYPAFCDAGAEQVVFNGTYKYVPGFVQDIEANYPKDVALLEAMKLLEAEQVLCDNTLELKLDGGLRSWGPFTQAYCMTKGSAYPDAGSGLQEMFAKLCGWAYAVLRAENDYANSDEAADEYLSANGLLFDEKGRALDLNGNHVVLEQTLEQVKVLAAGRDTPGSKVELLPPEAL